MSDRLTLAFGVLAPSLREQLAEQGLTCSEVDQFELDRTAISRLRISGLLPGVQVRKSERLLFSRISRNAAPLPSES